MAIFTAIGAAVAGSVFGLTAGTIAFKIVAGVVAAGLGLLTAKLMAPKAGNSGADPGNRIQLPPATDNKVAVIYGTAFMQGAITHAEIANENRTMYYVITLSEATQTGNWSCGDIYWNDEKLVFSGSDLSRVIQGDKYDQNGGLLQNTNYNAAPYKGSTEGCLYTWVFAGNGASGSVIKGSALNAWDIIPSWDSTYKMEGLVFAIVKVNYNSEKGFTALSPMTFQLTNSLKNPALVWKDYMTSKRYGAGLLESELDSNVWNPSDANSWYSVSNQTYSYTDKDGNPATKPRYEVNGVLSTQNDVMRNIDQILLAGACWMTFDVTQGKWKVVQKRAGSSVFSFDDSNIISSVQLSTTPLTDLYNQVEVEFPNKLQKDQNDYYRDAISATLRHPNEPDNRLRMRLDLVNNNVQAQQIGKIDLRQSRDDLIVNFTATYAALQCEAGDIVGITNEVYGWSNKLFRITRLREMETEDGNLVCEVTALEYNASVYSDDSITEFQPAPNINVPSFGASYNLTAPTTPTIDDVSETSTIPNFTIGTATGSTGGPWDRVDLFYTTDLSTNEYQYLTSKFPASGNVTFETAEAISFLVSGLPAGLYYFKARAGYQGRYTPFSSASAVLDWDPTLIADADPTAVAANLNWFPNPVSVPTDSTGGNAVTGQKIYLDLRFGTEIVDLSTSTDDTGMANDTWRLETETATGVTLSTVVKDTTNDRLEWTVNGISSQYATLKVSARYKDGTGTVISLGETILPITQLRAGADGQTAKQLRLTSTDQVFTRPKGVADTQTNQYVPASITFNALKSNISETITWSATNDLGNPVTLTGTGDVRYLSNTAFGNNSWVNVEATVSSGGTTYKDEITIVRVREGEDGDGAVNAYLTNETHGVPVNNAGQVNTTDTDADGIPNDLESCFTFMKVLIGGTDDSANWTYSKVDNGCTSTLTTSGLNKGRVQVTALGASDVATVEITATKTGYSPVTKVFTIDKQYRGADGASATTLRVVTSSQAFSRAKGAADQNASAYTPQAIAFKANITGMAPVPTINWYVARYNTDGSLGTEYFWTSGVTPSVMTASNFISWAQGKTTGSLADGTTAVAQGIRVRCTTTYSGTTYEDTTSIYKLTEGDSGVTMILDNEAHVLPADSSGTVTSFTGAVTNAKIFVGTVDDTANWTFTRSVSALTVTASGTPNGSTITVTAISAETGYVDITATKGTTTITKRFSVTKARNGANGSSAKILFLAASAMTFTYNNANVPEPGTQSVTLTANLQNLTGTATWTATGYNSSGVSTGPVSLGGTGNIRTMNTTQFGNNSYVVVTATIVDGGVGYTDTVTIVRLQAGVNGNDALVGYLTNESATVPADSNGVVASYALASGNFKVFKGLTDVTNQCTFSVVQSNGGSATINSLGAYSVTNMTVDGASFTLRATFSSVNIDKILTVTKSKAGAKGDQGDPGTPGAPGNNGLTNRRVYQNYTNNVTPTTPANTTGANTVPSGWLLNPPNFADGSSLWVSDGRYNSNTVTVDGVAPNTTIWGTPYRASVFFNTLQSDNYVQDTAGWRIVRNPSNNIDASAEFNNVKVRGRLDASEIYTTSLFVRNSTGGVSSTFKDINSGANLNSVANAGFVVWDTGNLGSNPWYSENFFLAGPNYHFTSPLGTATPQNRRIPRADQLRVVLTLNCQVDHFLSLIVKPNWSFSETYFNESGQVSQTKSYNANTWTNVGPTEVVSGYTVPQVGAVENQSGYGTASLTYVLTLSNIPSNALIYFGASVGGIAGIGADGRGRPAYGYAPLSSGASAIKSLNYQVIAFNT